MDWVICVKIQEGWGWFQVVVMSLRELGNKKASGCCQRLWIKFGSDLLSRAEAQYHRLSRA
jgi:hypothetical protein